MVISDFLKVAVATACYIATKQLPDSPLNANMVPRVLGLTILLKSVIERSILNG